MRSNPLKLSFLAALGSLLSSCGLVDSLPSRDARCDLRPAKDQCTDMAEAPTRRMPGAT
ncbi:hypothetical protein DB31_8968 [Hyalangium minutum]|uniref:Lipoprotein n=1 Tax=Hyalangium minutum TaxID=394096 RepID=A0A085WGE1_9BACT|nr:hypothetical protein DB31_8968 [Hyalangium minutum]